jgi:NAD(P)-dependent dehydrogenase (short-subunit alcohol dehydrogenase family)
MSNPTILITGASGGLGSLVVPFFLEKGYRVIATVAGEGNKNMLAPHPLLDVKVVDLSDQQAVDSFIARQIETYQNIDAAILLAGGFAMGNIGDTMKSGLKLMIAINFETAFNVSRALFGHMMDRGKGRIVFMGARPALEPSAGRQMVAYALSKSLLFRLAEILNADAKGKDVVTSVVVPSTIDTSANRRDMADADFSKWVKPEQLAEIFYFICSNVAAPLRDPVWKVYNNA